MLPWVIGVIVAAVILMLLVEFLMIRLNIRPADPAARTGGFRDILAKFREWSNNRNPGA